MKTDLTTRIKGLTLKNPVTVASGTFGSTDEYAGYVDYKKLGVIITKTVTVKPRPGNPMPRICETSSGMLNAIGLQNKGLEDFVEQKNLGLYQLEMSSSRIDLRFLNQK